MTFVKRGKEEYDAREEATLKRAKEEPAHEKTTIGMYSALACTGYSPEDYHNGKGDAGTKAFHE